MLAAYTALASTPTPLFSAAGVVIPSSSSADFSLNDGASFAWGPKDTLCSGDNIRTGNPGGTSRISFAHPLLAPGYLIDSISLQFRYAAGYTPAPGHTVDEPTVNVLLADSHGTALATVYASPPIGANYSFDHFTGYSPPVHATSSSLGVANEGLVFVVLEVVNHARNLQIPIDSLGSGFNASVQWKQSAVTRSS